jgi:hypothetical protein
VQDVFSKLITQREQYQAKAGQYEKAPGLEGAQPLLWKDPFVGYEAVLARLRNLATQAPLMDAAAAGMAKVAEAMGSARTLSVVHRRYRGAQRIGGRTGRIGGGPDGRRCPDRSRIDGGCCSGWR